MKHIIAQAYNQGEWFNKDFALIRVDDNFKEVVKQALDYINLAPEIFEDKVNILLYHIPSLNFYDSTMIEDLNDSDLCPDTQQILSAIVNDDDGRNIFDDDYIDILNTNNLNCIVGDVEDYYVHAVVSSNGVSFKASNKYGDGEEMWTDPIDFEMILNF